MRGRAAVTPVSPLSSGSLFYCRHRRLFDLYELAGQRSYNCRWQEGREPENTHQGEEDKDSNKVPVETESIERQNNRMWFHFVMNIEKNYL